jgi:hypothetical protein
MPAKSISQQRAMGIALSAKRGKIPVSKLRGAAQKMYDNMSEKQLKDYAKTKHNDLPLKKAPKIVKEAAFLDVDKVEDAMMQYLSGQPAKDAARLVEEHKGNIAIKHPILTGIPTLGIWPLVARGKALDKITRVLSRKYPEIKEELEKKRIAERQYELELEKAQQPERVVGIMSSTALRGLDSYLRHKNE